MSKKQDTQSSSLLNRIKEFKPTSWVVDNITASYVGILIIALFGLNIFLTLPKEQFPDIVLPQVYVSTVYFGNSPEDIENLITRPIEKEINAITGAKINKITSTSLQDFSSILVEFESDVNIDIARQKVKDAVDRADSELPSDLTEQPNVVDVAFSDFPIMFVNVIGDYDFRTLKKYADDIKERIETVKEINKAEIIGAPEREIQILVDKNKMEAAKLSFADIEQAIAKENINFSSGNISVGPKERTLRIQSQFKSIYDLDNIVIKNIYGQPVYIYDIAKIVDGAKDKTSVSRLNGNNVISISIVKRAGENLINTSKKVRQEVNRLKEKFPKDLQVKFTGDLSTNTKIAFDELINTIILGFIFVWVTLMFFMGVNNSFFVALSVPLSVFVAFCFLPVADLIIGTDVTLNFIVLFALLFGLGIIVDDAIVVIENTHRIFDNGKIPSHIATKKAAGEVFTPVLSGTLTTLAPFFPLLFWEGVIGKFMIYLPTILILTLSASLIVAFLMNTVFATSFMKTEPERVVKRRVFKSKYLWIAMILGVLFHLSSKHFIANLILFIPVLMVLNSYIFRPSIKYFQKSILPNLTNSYERSLVWALKKNRPSWLVFSTFVLFFLSIILFVVRIPSEKIQFFPSGDPNNIYIYLQLPVGTKIEETDRTVQQIENDVYAVLGKNNPIVESVITNVASGAGDPQSGDRSVKPNLARIQISFLEFKQRKGISTSVYLDELRKNIKPIPGATISVEKERNGPPTGAPVNIEMSSENYELLKKTIFRLQNYLEKQNIPGIEKLKLNVDLNKPEIIINIDKKKAQVYGLSSSQIGGAIRTALYGKEISKFKDNEDEYDITLRYNKDQRKDIAELMSTQILYRDFSTGSVNHVPISTVADISIVNSSGAITRKDLKNVIALYSNVLSGYSAQSVNIEIEKAIERFDYDRNNIFIDRTGELEEQQETNAFLGTAMIIAFLIIFFVLVVQFNSLSKTYIVLTEIIFSIIGVLLGFAIFQMNVPTIMVGVGIVGLSGIVVKNAILLIEFTDELKSRGYRTKRAIVQAGKIRIIPVLLTAAATILGLIPLAVGLNIDFYGLFENFSPNVFFGGDSVVFWGPLAWTIIFGLIFAFFMTLLLVPSMYLIAERLRRPMSKFYGTKWIALLGFLGPIFFVFILIMYIAKKIQGKPFIPKYLNN